MSWDVPDQEVLRVKTLLVTRTFSDALRDDSPDIPAIQFELHPEEFAPDESLEEELLLKREAFQREAAGLEHWSLRTTGRGPQTDQDSSPCRTCTRVHFFQLGQESNQSIAYVGEVLHDPWSRLRVLPARGIQLSECRFIWYGLQVVRKGKGPPSGSRFLLHQYLIFE